MNSTFSNLSDSLREHMDLFSDLPAFIEVDREREVEKLTFGQVKNAAERVAALLQEHGIAPGDRVALLMSNQSKWPLSAYGVFFAGGILVPIDYKLPSAEVIPLLEHAQPKVLIMEWPIWNRLVKNLSTLEGSPVVIVTEAPENIDLQSAIRWEALPSKSFTVTVREKDAVATIVYSSGTGGRPKGCMLTHENYLSQMEQILTLVPLTSNARYFSILPTNHAVDFVCGCLLPPQVGYLVIHQRTLRPEFLLATMKKYRITHMALVPLILRAFETRIREQLSTLPKWKKTLSEGLIAINSMLTKKKPRLEISRTLLKPIHQAFGGHLELIIAGGAFVEPSLVSFFYRLGLPIRVGYGLTEAGVVLTLTEITPSSSVGKPIPGLSLKINFPNSEGVGEVWAKGPSVMKGYFNEPSLTQETISDGWLKTGDLGRINTNGELHLIGRSKNMIVTEGGKNVYPEDIESTFDRVDGISEYCVFGTQYLWPVQTLSGDRLILVVRPMENDLPSSALEEIKVRNRALVDYKRISGYLVWNKEFPRTASQKIKRNVLADELKQKDKEREVTSLV